MGQVYAWLRTDCIWVDRVAQSETRARAYATWGENHKGFYGKIKCFQKPRRNAQARKNLFYSQRLWQGLGNANDDWVIGAVWSRSVKWESSSYLIERNG